MAQDEALLADGGIKHLKYVLKLSNIAWRFQGSNIMQHTLKRPTGIGCIECIVAMSNVSNLGLSPQRFNLERDWSFLGLTGRKGIQGVQVESQTILMVLIYKASPCCLSSFNLGASQGSWVGHSFRTLAACYGRSDFVEWSVGNILSRPNTDLCPYSPFGSHVGVQISS